MSNNILAVTAAVLAGAVMVSGQQVADRSFQPPLDSPAYPEGGGPVVCVDEAHANFHTLEGRFWAFGELIRRDGYLVRANREKFGQASLAECNILVIANAQPSTAPWNSYSYPTPPAFPGAEIEATSQWVQRAAACC